jgi:hypothetical protein
VRRRLEHLDQLRGRARDANRRLLDTQRVGPRCLFASPAFERAAHLSVEDGRRAPALRFGDPRVMALTGALCTSLFAATGITNQSLRARVAALLGTDYTSAQMSYDLRRLRMKDIITRQPGTNTYTLTPRRYTHRGVLHQTPQPTAATTHRRQPTTRTTAPASSPAHHRQTHRHLHSTGTPRVITQRSLTITTRHPRWSSGTWLKYKEHSDRVSLDSRLAMAATLNRFGPRNPISASQGPSPSAKPPNEDQS